MSVPPVHYILFSSLFSHSFKAGSSEGGESESFDPTSFYKQQQAEMMMQVRIVAMHDVPRHSP